LVPIVHVKRRFATDELTSKVPSAFLESLKEIKEPNSAATVSRNQKKRSQNKK